VMTGPGAKGSLVADFLPSFLSLVIYCSSNS
jgi:hypothetical protein